MRVVVVPVLSDNYSYLLIDDEKKIAACVDPAEAHIVLAKAKEEKVEIVAVLTTHHHMDHAGGNAEMVKQVPSVKVYGGRIDKVAACTNPLEHGDKFNTGSIEVLALHTPGHTRGSICYYCTEPGKEKEGLVFTGDTLFVAGCGRMFESTPEELGLLVSDLSSITRWSMCWVHFHLKPMCMLDMNTQSRICSLQWLLMAATRVLRRCWTGHKTRRRGKIHRDFGFLFGMKPEVQRKFTVPSTMRNEWLINPFLRSSDDTMRSICPGCSPVEVFATLRKKKDSF
eukprot:symbB.v1.2.015902.t1/scaffold1195.1/size134849/13